MTFKITGPNGEGISSISEMMQRVKQDAMLNTEKQFQERFESAIRSVSCPEHGGNVEVSASTKDKKMSFQSCCPKFETLANEAIKQAFE